MTCPGTLPDRSDGPERFHGGPKCPQHHAGQRTGLADWCCCCNPCLYDRPPQTISANDHCCRCVPKAIHLVFTPNESGNAECCRKIGATLFPLHSTTPPGYTTYGATIFGLQIQWTLGHYFEDDVGYYLDYPSPCRWRLTVPQLDLDETYLIDHVNTTCNGLPPVTLEGIEDGNGCVGTISFHEHDAVKIPFRKRDLSPTVVEPLPIDPPIGECTEIAKYLCVYGIRHPDLTDPPSRVPEAVEFTWNDEAQRYEYAAPCQAASEFIYLREDDYGNAYYRFEFEPGDNPEWGEEPLLDGRCNCGVSIDSTASARRFVKVRHGPCSMFNYICDHCRCAVRRICVFGIIDGQLVINELMEWDGDGWAGDTFRIDLIDQCGNCVAVARTLDGDEFDPAFLPSAPIDCGLPVLSFEMYSQNGRNWLWGQSSIAGECIPSNCGPCVDACGGPPEHLIVTLRARRLPANHPPVYPDPPEEPVYCTLEVDVFYFERWELTTVWQHLCGYIGFKWVDCEGHPDGGFLLMVVMEDFGGNLRIYRLVSGTWTEVTPNPGAVSLIVASCDPYVSYWPHATNWESNPESVCQWGCVSPTMDDYRFDIIEA